MKMTLNDNFLDIENNELQLITGGLTSEQWVAAICWAAGTLVGAAICAGVSWIFGKLC